MITTKKPTLLEELRNWTRENPVHWRLEEVRGAFLRALQEAFIQHRPHFSGEQLRERMRGYCDGTGTVPDWCFNERYVDAVHLIACHFERFWRRRELGR